MFKLQSALEYLMTYGWAILIIGVVLGAMFAIGIFNPGTVASPECIMPAGFSCLNDQLATNGMLTINLEQATATPVNIIGIACSTNSTIPSIPNLPTQIAMSTGSNYTFTNFFCTKGGVTYTGTAGSLFTGSIGINYTDTTTGFPHIAYGQLVVRYT